MRVAGLLARDDLFRKLATWGQTRLPEVMAFHCIRLPRLPLAWLASPIALICDFFPDCWPPPALYRQPIGRTVPHGLDSVFRPSPRDPSILALCHAPVSPPIS